MSAPTGNGPFRLEAHPAHLGTGATTVVQPEFSGDLAWYAGYGQRHGAEGPGARLLSMHSFDGPWDMWEVHPSGTEVVIVTAGKLTLLQEHGEEVVRIELAAGEYAINPPGVWHTADADAPVTAVFITCGAGTQQRPR